MPRFYLKQQFGKKTDPKKMHPNTTFISFPSSGIA